MPLPLEELIKSAKRLARQYRDITGKPLGITGEIGELEAARILGLKLAPPRTPGYDATRKTGDRIERLQIKSRVIPSHAKPGQRLGSIRFDHRWDFVILVLLDEDFEPTEIYEAPWRSVENALRAPGSKARNERGALSVSKFKSIGERIWP
jgi:hypothetical protein